MKRRLALLTLAGLAITSACALGGDSPSAFPDLPQAALQVTTESGTHHFQVWIAADDASRTRGLMHVRTLPADRGMLFLFERPQLAAFWMKDTYLSLDMIFIGPDAIVVNVAENTRPLSLEPIESAGPVTAVLEVPAGTARRIGLRPGDRIPLPTLRTTFVEPRHAPAMPATRSPD
jgi:uncharacterized membrane protein (UPF0127 family)